MGVQGLWPLLSEAATSCNLEALDLAALGVREVAVGAASSSREQRLPIIGVDLSAWLYHARQSVEGSNPVLRLIFFRLTRLLSLPLRAVFVFDGPERPRSKRGRNVGGGKHPLTGPLREMITACGAASRMAPGEAEAELARMSRAGLIDAVLSDDSDALVFGATAVLRNWSATLPANHAVRNKKGVEEAGENNVSIYRSSDIEELPETALDRNGLVLIALLAGGDYDVKGLGGCGAKLALSLAQGSYGSSLVKGFEQHCKIAGWDSDSKMPQLRTATAWQAFRENWIADVKVELETNRQGFLATRHVKLADSDALRNFLGTKEALEVLASYLHPRTSWTREGLQDDQALPALPTRLKFSEPDLPKMAAFAQRTFAWGPKTTVARLRNVAWKGMLLRSLRNRAVSAPRAHVNTASLHRAECSSDEEKSHDDDESSPLTVTLLQIHSERTHPDTGKMLEYRIEWDPSSFARAAEKGIDPFLNVGPGYDEPFPDGSSSERQQLVDPEDEEAADFALGFSQSKGDTESTTELRARKTRSLPDPYSSLRSWVLAERLRSTTPGRSLIQDYERTKAAKSKRGKGATSTRNTTRETPASSSTSKRATKAKGAAVPHRRIDSIFFGSKASLPRGSKTGATAKCVTATDLSQHRATEQIGLQPDSATASQVGHTVPHETLRVSQRERTFGRTQSGPAVMQSPARNVPSIALPVRRRASIEILEEDESLLSPTRPVDDTIGDHFLSAQDPDSSLPDGFDLLRSLSHKADQQQSPDSSFELMSPKGYAASAAALQEKKRARLENMAHRRGLRDGSGSPQSQRARPAAGVQTSCATIEAAAPSIVSSSRPRAVPLAHPLPDHSRSRGTIFISRKAVIRVPETIPLMETSAPSQKAKCSVSSGRKARGARKSDAIVLSDSD